MANSRRPTVNQRMYFARLHLDWMAEQIDARQLAKQLVEKALGESAVLHLVMAYRHYLAEVAETYQWPVTLPADAAALAGELREAGVASAECNELLGLEQDDSWLAALLRAFDAIGLEAAAGPDRRSGPDLIALQAVDDGPFSQQTLEAAYAGLRQVIDNQRLRLEEW